MSNEWLDEVKNTKAAVVVAHPDDEVMWAGGLLSWWQKNAPCSITIICCSIPETEPERAWKFFDACEHFNARPRLYPYTEVRGGLLKSLADIDLSSYTTLFTHNAIGEYGHAHHKQVHAHCMGTKSKHLFNFGYGVEGGQSLEFDWYYKFAGIVRYNHISQVTCGSKWRELIRRWGVTFKLNEERYIKIR